MKPNYKDKVQQSYPCAVLDRHEMFPNAMILIHDFAVFDRPYDPNHPGRMLLGYGRTAKAAWKNALDYIHGI